MARCAYHLRVGLMPDQHRKTLAKLRDAVVSLDNTVSLLALKSGKPLSYPPVLVGTGISGAVFVPELASLMNRLCAIVRKTTHDCHSSISVETSVDDWWYNQFGIVHWYFIDDLIDTGATITRCINMIGHEPSGVITYAGGSVYQGVPHLRVG